MNKKKIVKKSKRAVFWLISSRGTDIKAVYDFPSDYSRSQIEDACHDWADKVGPKTSESVYRYGFNLIKVRSRQEILAEYSRVCAARRKVENRFNKLAAELNPRKWGE